jgi:hypothetical protein
MSHHSQGTMPVLKTDLEQDSSTVSSMQHRTAVTRMMAYAAARLLLQLDDWLQSVLAEH